MARRRALAARYDSLLASLANVVKPVPRLSSADDGWHLYPVLIDFQALGLSRADVMMRLRDAGVGTQVHYIPVHRQPYYRALYPGLSLPGADAYYERCLSLPLFPAMNDNDVDTVVNALAGILTDAA
ncbi:DegT/DnrJ/EryC1/StrS family aminotransferase [Denitrobaculum tricleocarpae]|uniref:DegT/DnrJ/EryC1/StrS family aminotransferase n=1 Tax=Denitrobaculum tricleocarpae TaxID=2591009 RepID=UPI002482806E|nr:DegT/DnrJ/EryC1/StrS family aminotransferase [Denitrobaculum tricleocarpae]